MVMKRSLHNKKVFDYFSDPLSERPIKQFSMDYYKNRISDWIALIGCQFSLTMQEFSEFEVQKSVFICAKGAIWY